MTLELKHVGKTVGAEVWIYPTDLVLAPGRFNILLGTTLAGKTTLMTLMAGLDQPTSGRIFFNGRDVTGEKVQKRNVSMVYQQFINYPNFTVFENIASPLRVARLPEAEIRARVGRIAELLRITPMLDRYPDALSGGQQQRCAMARALVKDSDLILLDEPLANLDFKLREELREELPRLFAERERVIVYATTEPTEALLLGGHTATMHKGRITDFGPTERVYRQPKDLITARVFSEPPLNTAPIRIHNGECDFAGSVRWPAPEALGDGDYTLGLRPHHISPLRKGEADVAVESTVKVAEIAGSESIVHFIAFGEHWISQEHGVHPFEPGQRTVMHADMSRAFYFHSDGRLAIAPAGSAGSEPEAREIA